MALGTLNILGYVELTLSTSEIELHFLFTFPQANATYSKGYVDEYIAYVQVNPATVKRCIYQDVYGAVELIKTPYNMFKHSFNIYRNNRLCIFPDVNFDAVVDQKDYDLIKSCLGAVKGQANYNSAYDVYPDDKIDNSDIGVCLYFFGTWTFKANTFNSYSIGGTVSFAFVAEDSIERSTVVSSQFIIADYDVLSGKWYLNNALLNENSYLTLDNGTLTLKFVDEDPETDPSEVNATIISIDTRQIQKIRFNRIEQNVWQARFTIEPGKYSLLLIASSGSAFNKLNVAVEVLQPQIQTTGFLLIICGGALLIAGFLIEEEKTGISYR